MAIFWFSCILSFSDFVLCVSVSFLGEIVYTGSESATPDVATSIGEHPLVEFAQGRGECGGEEEFPPLNNFY